MTLKQNGYNTMALGKWHLAPYTDDTAAGPFEQWSLAQDAVMPPPHPGVQPWNAPAAGQKPV